MLLATYRHLRKLVIFIVGLSVLLVGIAMIVLPGPAFVVIPAGLAILATEFVWARSLLRRLKQEVVELKDKVTKHNKEPSEHRHRDSD